MQFWNHLMRVLSLYRGSLSITCTSQWDMWYAIFKSSPFLSSMVFSGPTMCADLRHLGHPGWSVWPICQTQNVLNVALLGPKISQNRLKSLLATEISPKGKFWIGSSGKRLEHQCRHLYIPVWAICHTKNVPNVALQGPKRDQNMLNMKYKFFAIKLLNIRQVNWSLE